MLFEFHVTMEMYKFIKLQMDLWNADNMASNKHIRHCLIFELDLYTLAVSFFTKKRLRTTF